MGMEARGWDVAPPGAEGQPMVKPVVVRQIRVLAGRRLRFSFVAVENASYPVRVLRRCLEVSRAAPVGREAD